jgi:alanyl-tRNA synthetase
VVAVSLEEIAARVEADELLAAASPNASDICIVSHVFDNRDAESLKRLALALISHPKTIALLGSRDKETARVVFAKAADAPGDMNLVMRAACEALDGRGGGKPDMAQGGGKNVENLPQVIEQSKQMLG